MKTLIAVSLIYFCAYSLLAKTPIIIKDYILKPNGRPSMVSTYQNKLIVLNQTNKEIKLFNISNLTQSESIHYGTNYIDIDVNRNGYMAVCLETGTKLILKNLITGAKAELDMVLIQGNEILTSPPENADENKTDNCATVSFDSSSNQNPTVWVGSPYNQSIIKLAWYPSQHVWKVLKRYSPISGPFVARALGDYIFTGVGNVFYWWNMLPLIIKKEAPVLEVVVGDALADNIPVANRPFGHFIFADKSTNQAYYLYAANGVKALVGLLAQKPQSEPLAYTINIPNPRSISRYANCLAVLGSSNDGKSRPIWQIFKNKLSLNGIIELEHVKQTDFFNDERAFGTIYSTIDKNGNYYLSTRDGISVVSGVFADLNCESL